ncbi:MAG: transcriptional regulator-like protein [Frankiales bacterium]|nr:transcriptional regulator-like protein [Frankiales bacterium]
MSARKTERLLNLVIALLSTRGYLTAAQIIEAVAGYEADGESARRMFERDKEELRELGVPLQTGTQSTWDDEPGYRIPRDAYALPDLNFQPDEAAAIGLAARLLSTATLGEAAGRALVKLRAAGLDVEPPPSFEPRGDAGDPSFTALLAAVRAGQSVHFGYRTRGTGEPAERHVDLWGVVSWRGRWYAVGHDHARADARVFRLDRIVGDVRPGPAVKVGRPDGLELRHMVAESQPGDHPLTATVRVRPGTCLDLRRFAASITPAGDVDVLDIPFGDTRRLGDLIAGHGASAVVDSPDELRAAVIAALESAAQAVAV